MLMGFVWLCVPNYGYDPVDMETVTVYCRGTAPVRAHWMEIGAFASKVPPVPMGMTGSIPETSRLLDALEKKYKDDHGQMVRFVADHEMLGGVG